jgi:hypothetical protein
MSEQLWLAVKADAEGHTYYFNTLSRETSWSAPAVWWEELKDPSGLRYYMNGVTRVTQWDPPPGLLSDGFAEGIFRAARVCYDDGASLPPLQFSSV